MRQVDKKYFGDVQSGRLNADDSPFAITTNEWVNAENVRSGTTDKGFTGIVESIGGNVELPRPLPLNTLDSVVIGTQTWTSKNLDVTTFANGETIIQATSTEEWYSLLGSNTPAWAYWDYNEANASLGKYYNTFAINSLKGLAPKGWHIPSVAETAILYNFVSVDHPQTAYALREMGTTHWQSADGTDNYGFSMQGNSALESTYYEIKYYGFFATSDNNVAKFSYSYPNAIIDSLEVFWGLNIRLVRDKEYTEVKIGEQIWIGENYEGIRYRNGELIPQVTDPTAWAALTTGAWCWYNNDETTYGQYGRLYNSYAINDPRGFAPEGYYVPTDSGVFDVESTTDFAILSNYLGGDSISGAKLKETGTTHWISPNAGSTNSSGFTALPGSTRGADGFFPGGIFGIGQYGVFGSSNKNYPLNYNSRRLENGINYFSKATVGAKEGVSVRLLKSQYITIGSVEDTENNRILYFNYDTSPNRIDKITCLYTDTNTQYDVLYGSQVNSNIVTDIAYNESYNTTINITGILNQLSFSDSSILPYLQVGYKIRINNTGFAGDYIISAVNSSTITVTLYETLPGVIFTPTSASITIFSATTTYKSNGLNFSKDSLIHSAKMSGNILSWVDGTNNEPRKINVESAIKANYINFETTATPYSFPLDFSQITMIKRPPAFTPNFVKSYDSTFSNNFILNDSFEFAFQYEYYDSEVSVVGSYSQASKPNFPNDTYNCINVSMDYREVIPSTVKRVNLIARKGNGNPTGSDYAFIINTWDRSIELQNQQIENQNNSNSNFLSFTFYYDAIGSVIAVDDVIRPYDLVPIFSQTHEVAKSRYFLANNTLGYDTPKTTSLTVQLAGQVTLEGTSQTFNVLKFYCGLQITTDPYIPPYRWSNAGYYIYLTYNQAVPGYYLINGTDNTTTTPTNTLVQPNILPPSPIAVTAITFKGASLSQVAASVQPAGVSAVNFKYTVETGLTRVITGLTNVYYNVLTHQSNYKLGIAFYDYAMRKCGVCAVNNSIQNLEAPMYRIDSRTFGIPVGYSVPFRSRQKITVSGLPDGNGEYTVISLGFATVSLTNLRTIVVGEDIASFADASIGTISYVLSDIQLSTPTRDYAYTTAYSNGIWSLNEKNRLEEIPEWACYYSIVKTLDLRTRFFIQSFSNSLKYVTRNSDGTFAYTSNYQINQTYAIGINTNYLVYSGLGYTFTEGDQCILWSENGQIHNLQVLTQEGNYIFVTPINLGVFNSPGNYNFAYEIYTPYKESDSEPYYEFGEIYKIINPGSQYRTYEQLFGIIPPDSYVFTRSYQTNTYLVNAMSPNDIYWKRWDSDAGKVNVITKIGQSVKNTNIVWSDTYITGTQLNGSSTFRFGNDTYVSDDCGSINKLQLTSKVQDQGSVMLSLCSVETNSMYLGETQITDSTGAVQFFSGTQNVISTINTMKGNYGCVDPASVVQYRGNVYFLDASNGRWVQYSANGLDNISSIKMSRFWKNWCLKYLSMGKSEIEAFGDRPFVFATVDPFHDELLVSIPKLSNTPPQGYLPDYPSMVYPFDILDYQGKTIVYKLGTGAVVQPHWQGAYTFTVENFITLQNRLFTFKNGFVYEHNQPTNIVDQNTFFGDYFPSKIMFTSNILPQLPKVYDNFVSESNLIPNFVYFYNNYPKLQMSDLDETSFINLEGVWYAVILRNKRVDTGTSYTYDGLLTAEVMRNTNMYVLTEFSPTTEILQLRLLQLGMSISKGHTI